MICPNEFYKWLRAFKLVGTGAGAVDLSYGEMVISNNVRATSGNFPSFDWTKVEAGNANLADSPPQYTFYGGGNLNNWVFDSDNARLVYTGTDPQVAKVTLSMSACMETGVDTYVTFALRKNENNDTDAIKTKSLKPVTLPQGLNGSVITNAVDVTLQANDVFNPGDFLDFVVFNNSDTNKPIVHEMDLVVSEMKGVPVPVSNNQVITNRVTNVVTNRATNVVTNRQTT